MDRRIEPYLAFAGEVDRATARLRERHPGAVRCRAGCDLCCRDFFPITALEADGVRQGLELLPDFLRESVRRRARAAVDELARRGIDPARLDDAARALAGTPHALCPMNEGGLCTVYDHRPIVCRTFGYPADGLAHPCPGGNFADPNADYGSLAGTRIEARLARLALAHVAGTARDGRGSSNLILALEEG